MMTSNSMPHASGLDAWQAGLYDDRLRALLQEDAPQGDLTTRALGLGPRPGLMHFEARAPMRPAALAAAARLLVLCGAEVLVQAPDGSDQPAGALLLQAHGPAPGLLLAWKTAQTLVEACSGIATATAAIVTRLREAGHAVPLACTRKAFPGTRWWAALAVQAGGGMMHRTGLSETLLVFPEHRAFLSTAELAQAMHQLRQGQPEKRRVVEVGSQEEALQQARLGAEVLQLERFSPPEVAALRQALQRAGLAALLAPAGGVNLANAVAFADAGADVLVSSAPYFAPPADVRVQLAPA